MTDQFVYDEDYFVVADDPNGKPTTFRRVPASNLPNLPALTSRYVPIPLGTPAVGKVAVVSDDDPLTFVWGDGGGGGGGLTEEQLDDRVASLLVAGTGITTTYDDAGGTLTIAGTVTQYTDEMARDAIGAALVAGAGITITANDVANTITVAASTVGFENWTNLGNLGATQTVAGVSGAVYRAFGTLDQNCTVALSMQNNEQIELLLIQDGSGGRTTTFTGVTSWTGGTPSTGARTAGQADRYFFERVNGNTYGYWITA